MLITGKKQHTHKNLTSSSFVFVASKTPSDVLDVFGLSGNKEACDCSPSLLYHALVLCSDYYLESFVQD